MEDIVDKTPPKMYDGKQNEGIFINTQGCKDETISIRRNG